MKCWAASDENIFFLLLNSTALPGANCSLYTFGCAIITLNLCICYAVLAVGLKTFYFAAAISAKQLTLTKRSCRRKGGGALIFPPLTFTVLLLIKNSAVYLYLSWNTQTHPAMYCILKICWFICKDCARWNRKILLKTPSYQSRAYLACLNSVVPFSLCPRWLWKAHHASVSS